MHIHTYTYDIRVLANSFWISESIRRKSEQKLKPVTLASTKLLLLTIYINWPVVVVVFGVVVVVVGGNGTNVGHTPD
jgi:hypothetical protein